MKKRIAKPQSFFALVINMLAAAELIWWPITNASREPRPKEHLKLNRLFCHRFVSSGQKLFCNAGLFLTGRRLQFHNASKSKSTTATSVRSFVRPSVRPTSRPPVRSLVRPRIRATSGRHPESVAPPLPSIGSHSVRYRATIGSEPECSLPPLPSVGRQNIP